MKQGKGKRKGGCRGALLSQKSGLEKKQKKGYGLPSSLENGEGGGGENREGKVLA